MPLVLTPVKSSNIEAIGHHGGDLHVRFVGGTTYRYKGVPVDLHSQMLEAESVGGFFRDKVRGKFVHVKQDA